MTPYLSSEIGRLLRILLSAAILLLIGTSSHADLNLSFDFYEVGTSTAIVQPIPVGQMFDAAISVTDTTGSGVSGAVFDWTFDALLTQTPTSGSIPLISPWTDLGTSAYSGSGGHLEAYALSSGTEIARATYTANAPGTATFDTVPFTLYPPEATVFATFDDRGFFFDGTCNPDSPTSCAGESVQFQTGSVQIVTPSTVTGGLFYNDTIYDGNGTAVIAAVDANAVDPTKSAFQGPGTLGPASLSNNFDGINGIRIDVDNAAGPLTAADIELRVGDDQDTQNWPELDVTTYPFDSVLNGTTWENYIGIPNGLVVDQSLKVTVLANLNTLLPEDESHFWSHLTGDANGSGNINILDISSTASRFNQSSSGVSDKDDYNKDGTINILDISTVASRFSNSITILNTNDGGWSVPEPSGLALLGIAAIGLLGSRRR